MLEKAEQFLYFLDFTGIYPNLRIFNHNNYKSKISSVISVIVIITSVTFIIYSIVDFVNQNPEIIYYKNIDNNINKAFKISDSFQMVKFSGSDECFNDNEEPYFIWAHYSHTNLGFPIFYDLETCELGKNIDLKFKSLIEKFEKNTGDNISEYFCVDFNGTNIDIFNNENDKGYLKIGYLKEVKETCKVYPHFEIKIVTENDMINHNNKSEPFIPFYNIKNIEINNLVNRIDIFYNFQYIKYDSDNGIFFQNFKSYDLISFSDLSYDIGDNLFPEYIAICIDFNINDSNYDNYKRIYKKIPSLIADITGIINLIMIIGKFLSNFLLEKQMSRDIIYSIINQKEISTNKKIDLTFDKAKFNKNDKIDIKNNLSERDNQSESSTITNNSKSKKNSKFKIKLLQNLKFCDFFKSNFCCVKTKYKLINTIDNILKEEICIDNILRRLYILEKKDKQFNISRVRFKLETKSKYDIIEDYISTIIQEKINEDKTRKINNT